MGMYVQVVVNVPQVSGVFDYAVPAEFSELVLPGSLVVVPFGKRTVQGLVLRQVETPSVPQVKAIEALLDAQPVLTAKQLRLGEWLAQETLAPLGMCLDLMLPPGLSKQADTLYRLAQPPEERAGPLSATQQRILDLIRERGDLRGRQIEAAFRHARWQEALKGLVSRGWLVANPLLPQPTARPKSARIVQLAVTPEAALSRMDNLGRGAAQARREAILRFLIQEGLPVQVSWAYAASGGNLQDLYSLAEAGLVRLGESEVWRDPLERVDFVLSQPPTLTAEQAAVWQAMEAGLQACARGARVQPFLLHGVTGSGKTEIYLRAVEQTLALGRSAIVMVPEISLTPQTVRRFLARFPGQVGLVHSRLSDGERYDTWRRVRSGQLRVIVGPRSALFSPVKDLGLLVVDEFHEESYYQDDLEPRYHAVAAAVAYARLGGAAVILGSATPDIAWLYRAREEGWSIQKLPLRILAHRQAVESMLNQPAGQQLLPPVEGDAAWLPLPPVTLIDMRQELKANNRSIFSRPLQNALRNTLEANQQAILFLNRRGMATYVFCRECGASVRCPRCDIPLTFHVASGDLAGGSSPTSGEGGLVCHRCNYRRQMPRKCPQCASNAIRQFGTGTEKVEAEVKQLFPQARVLRWDYDTTRQKGSHELIMSHFVQHRADVLVGTQMLAKGLDLPLVTLVGVVLADMGLNLPDYRAAERTFQLMVQVSGRAGRSPLGGQVILQTFNPDAYPLQAAAFHDYDSFYRHELELRRSLEYPPFNRLVRLEFRHADPQRAEETARGMAQTLLRWIEQAQLSATRLIGPAPCFYARRDGQYRWQVILRGPNPAQLLRGRPLGEWRVEVDPLNLL